MAPPPKLARIIIMTTITIMIATRAHARVLPRRDKSRGRVTRVSMQDTNDSSNGGIVSLIDQLNILRITAAIFLTIGDGSYKHEKKESSPDGVAQWIERQPEKEKGHGFDSQSGHMPGLHARSRMGHV